MYLIYERAWNSIVVGNLEAETVTKKKVTYKDEK